MRATRRVVLALLLAAAAVPGLLRAAAGAPETCPACGAERRPGAAFCVNCGARFASAPAPAGAPRPAVVQVVAAHDAELTSTLASIVWETKLRVDSLVGSAFSVGGGEFVTDSGLMVGARAVKLRTPAGSTVDAQVVGTDAMIGITLLKANVPEVAPLLLRPEPARVGEGMSALGYASGAQARGEPIATHGVVSGLHRGAEGIHPIEDYLQSDASLPRGLAGGPMLDSAGRVLGMSTAMVMGDEVLLGPQSGIGFAVPAAWIERALAWIRAGAPPRAWIGALAVPSDPARRDRYRLPAETRLVIEHIFPGSPAAAAGLKRGDGLLDLAGEPITTLPRAQERLLSARSGEPLALRVARPDGPLAIDVSPVPRPDRPRLSAVDALRFFCELEVAPRGEDLVVGTVRTGSMAADGKIAAGDVLKSVLSKKDWEHGASDNSRWRSVRGVDDLEERLATAYSDFDFAVGLRFKAKDGAKREMYVWKILTPTGAL